MACKSTNNHNEEHGCEKQFTTQADRVLDSLLLTEEYIKSRESGKITLSEQLYREALTCAEVYELQGGNWIGSGEVLAYPDQSILHLNDEEWDTYRNSGEFTSMMDDGLGEFYSQWTIRVIMRRGRKVARPKFLDLEVKAETQDAPPR